METKIKKKNKKYFFIFSHSQNSDYDTIELIFSFVSFYEKYMNTYLLYSWYYDIIRTDIFSFKRKLEFTVAIDFLLRYNRADAYFQKQLCRKYERNEILD